jgi:hypothetical protein
MLDLDDRSRRIEFLTAAVLLFGWVLWHWLG